MAEQVITAEAVDAAAKAYRSEFPYDENEGYVVKLILEAAAPHMMPTTEWGIFRATDDETATPTENRRYVSRAAAERHLRYDYAQPEFWEVRGRRVGEWSKDAV